MPRRFRINARRASAGLAGLMVAAGFLAAVLNSSPTPVLAAPPGEGDLKAPPATPELLARGKDLFAKNCASCHGVQGKGDGEAAYLLVPKPRDLTRSSFRLISTENQIARVEDIFAVITRGMPGSSMPPWDRLPEEERWALAHFTKSLAPKDGEKPQRIVPGPEPAKDDYGLARGRQLFVLSCAACHGVSGRGDGQQRQVDEQGFPTRPRDLTRGIFKGSADPGELFYRIRAGMPGTPMPASAHLSAEETWHLVHYLQSLSGPGAEARSRLRFKTLTAKKLAAPPPDDPQDKAWTKVSGEFLALMPLAWRDERVEGVIVRAGYDANDLYLHLSWEDASCNDEQLRVESFSDGASVQLSAEADPPFFAMGAKGAGDVRIWFWKASREKDQEGFQDVQAAYPHMYVAHYPEMKDGPVAGKAVSQELLDKHNPKFLTGRGAGNIVSAPCPAGAESLTAHGLGSLGARPLADRNVRAKGSWQRGVYGLVFRRPLKQDGEKALALEAGQKISIAFAVWDGAAGDRNGQKSVTIWHTLTLEK